MNEGRAEQLCAAATSLRVPLSRIRLAAQRMARLAPSPGGSELALVIEDAVGELDAGIAHLGSALAPAPPVRLEPCAPVFRETLRRLGPVLLARGASCEADTGDVDGDPLRVRHATIELLRAASGLSASPAALRLRLQARDDGFGVEASLRTNEPISEDGRERGAKQLIRFALAQGGEPELDDLNADPHCWRAGIWFRAPIEAHAPS